MTLHAWLSVKTSVLRNRLDRVGLVNCLQRTVECFYLKLHEEKFNLMSGFLNDLWPVTLLEHLK